MTYQLYIGDRTFSSWSMRGWLMLEAFDFPYESHSCGLYSGTLQEDLAAVAPARTVPAMATPEGHVVTDSLAMAETLHERHPDHGLYPSDPAARALARSIVAEMHSGYGALRDACPMQLSHQWVGFEASDAVRADLDRIEALWARARASFGASGPWLFGAYSLADVFHAPVAMRIAGYDLPVSEIARAYVNRHLEDPAVRRWRAMALTEQYDPFPYPQPLRQKNWPGPSPEAAQATDLGPAENAACPYSGRAVTHNLMFRERVFGFCNAFCRDKTQQDPTAFPSFMSLVDTAR